MTIRGMRACMCACGEHVNVVRPRCPRRPAQASALRRQSERPVLLVEGHGHSVPHQACRGTPSARVSVAVVFGVPVLMSEGPEESAGIMVTAAPQLAETTM